MQGKVRTVSLISNENTCFIEIELPQPVFPNLFTLAIFDK